MTHLTKIANMAVEGFPLGLGLVVEDRPTELPFHVLEVGVQSCALVLKARLFQGCKALKLATPPLRQKF